MLFRSGNINTRQVAEILPLAFPKRKISDTPIVKEFEDDNFKFDENGKKFSKRKGNAVGKGEIACYEQFIHFPQCSQKAYTGDT